MFTVPTAVMFPKPGIVPTSDANTHAPTIVAIEHGRGTPDGADVGKPGVRVESCAVLVPINVSNPAITDAGMTKTGFLLMALPPWVAYGRSFLAVGRTAGYTSATVP